MSQYYIDISGAKDGPHDLVTIMRRIRAEKIGPETGIYVDDSETATPAATLIDTALFFSRNQQEKAPVSAKQVEIPSLRYANLVHEGWRFVSENSIMTAFAGGLLLLTLLITAGMVQVMGIAIGGTLSWIVFIMFHYIYLICSQRIFRGQPFSIKFWNEQLTPIISMLLFAAIVLGIMMIGGFILFVIPGILVAVWYAFVPFFIIDRNMTLIESMHASRLLVQKHNSRYQLKIAMLILMHIACVILIIPIPLSLPMFGASLSRFYEELSTS